MFGYDDWQEWNFGIVFKKSDTGVIWDFEFVSGVEYKDNSSPQEWVYEWIIKIPDQENEQGSIAVGDCFTPIYYDYTQAAGQFSPEVSQYDAPEFCIGEPYMPPSEYNDITDYISAVYTVCNVDLDHLNTAGELVNEGCATYDEMVACFEFGE